MNKIEKSAEIDKKITFIICFHLVVPNCKNMLVGTSRLINNINDLLNQIILVFVIGLYCWLFLDKKIYKTIPLKAIYIVLFCISFILISCLIDPLLFVSKDFPYNYVFSQFRTFVAYCLPLFLAISLLRNYEYFTEKLLSSTFIMFACATIAELCSIIPGWGIETSRAVEYSMGYGNAVLLLSLLLLYKIKKNGKLSEKIQFILTCIYIGLSGSRGPLLVIAIAIVISLFYGSHITKKNFLIYFVCFIMAIVCLIKYEAIVNFLIKWLQKYGVESRTLQLISANKVFYDSGRSTYYITLRNALAKSPILGLGAFGGETLVGLTHSLYLDIFANFGYIFGGIYIIYIILKGSIIFKKEHSTAYGIMLLVFFIMVFPRGFFAGSLWTSRELWMIMGMYIGYNKVIEKRKEEKSLASENGEVI